MIDSADTNAIIAQEAEDLELFIEKTKAVEEIYDKWKDGPLLEEFDDGFRKVATAIILDNQRVFLNAAEYGEQFNENALKITSNVFKDFVGFDMVSVQPMLRPSDNIFYNKFKFNDGRMDLNITKRLMRAVTKRTRSTTTGGLTEMVEILSDELRNEITQEITIDLKNNVGTTFTKDKKYILDAELLYINLMEASGVINKKTLRGEMKWVVVGSEIARTLGEFLRIEYKQSINIQKIGTIGGRLTFIVMPLYPPNQILCGGIETLSEGYIYSPYVFFNKTPMIMDPDSFCLREGYLTRSGKCLLSARPYAKIIYQ